MDTVEASGLTTVVTCSVTGIVVDSTGAMVLMIGLAVLSSFSFVGISRKDGLGMGWGTSVGWGEFGCGCHWEIWGSDLSRNSFIINGEYAYVETATDGVQ